MSRKIIGVTVGTPISPQKIAEKLKPVKTVNGIAPDENGNVVVAGGSGGAGADGFSPIASVTQTDSGAVISITDKSGTTTATVTNGKDGQDGYTPQKNVDYFDGKDGSNGADGASPTVAVSKSGKVTTVTITDKNGTKTATINDGADGAAGSDGKDGVSATHSWNGTTLTVTSESGTSSANLKGDKGDTGATGQRGTGLLAVTAAPASYTTAVGGITPKYRMAISTIKTQAGVTEVLLGDTIRYSYYQYPIDYLDASYAYCTTRVSLRGTTGKTAYQYAQDGGYAGTETEFSAKLSETAVSVAPQTLTPEQQAQARQNIGVYVPVKSLTKNEFANMSDEDAAKLYNDGIRMIVVEDGYTNLVPAAIGKNGAIYYGCGYLNNYRLTSSGDMSLQDGSCVSGYIPYDNNSMFRVAGSRHVVDAGGQYVAAYDSSFNLISVAYISNLVSGGSATYVSRADGVYELAMDTSKISAWKNAAYFRVSCSSCVGADLIITKNEVIGLEV